MCDITRRGDVYLLEWGIWARRGSGFAELRYPSRSAEQMADGVARCNTVEEDPVCEYVDRVLLDMQDQRNRQMAVMYYVMKINLFDIGKQMQLSKGMISNALNITRSVVYGALQC